MQAISHRPTEIAAARPRGFWKGVACLCAEKTSHLAVLVLRVIACVVSIFGKCGRKLAEKLRSKAKRFYVVYVAHNKTNMRSAPLPLLVPARNLAHRDVVHKREDVAEARAMRERLLAPGFLKKKDPKMEGYLKKAQFKGANKKGICVGASLCFVKSVLNARCDSEDKLMRVSQTFSEGFPKEAAGLQMMHQRVWPSEISKSAKQGVADLCDQEIADIVKGVEGKCDQVVKELQAGDAQNVRARLDKIEEEEVNKGKARLKMRKSAFEKIAFKMTEYGKIAKLVGIKIRKHPMHDFLQFDINAATRQRFNALPKGNYILRFSTKKGGHAMSYHKLDFGSYFFDPNFGLMECQVKETSKDLAKLLNRYPGRPDNAQDGAHQLMIFPCELAK